MAVSLTMDPLTRCHVPLESLIEDPGVVSRGVATQTTTKTLKDQPECMQPEFLSLSLWGLSERPPENRQGSGSCWALLCSPRGRHPGEYHHHVPLGSIGKDPGVMEISRRDSEKAPGVVSCGVALQTSTETSDW